MDTWMLNRILYACSFIVFRIESMREHEQENKYLWTMVYLYDEINIKYLKVYAQDFFLNHEEIDNISLNRLHWILEASTQDGEESPSETATPQEQNMKKNQCQ